MPSWGALHNSDAVFSSLINSRLSKQRICLQLQCPPSRNRVRQYSDQRCKWSRYGFLDRLEQEQKRRSTKSGRSLHRQTQNNVQWPSHRPNDRKSLSTTTNARQGKVGSPKERAHLDESFNDVYTRSHKNEAILPALKKELEQAAVKVPNATATNKVLRKIIFDEHVRPEVSHYEALVLSNCDPKNGSVDMIETVLQEMQEQKIVVGSALYTACLRVLAVHPDYLVRTTILDKMRSHWLASTPSADHWLVAGYVKDGQLELAMQTLEGMRLRKVRIEQWLWTLMLYSLCAAEDFDAIMKLIYQLDDDGIELTGDVVSQILEKASRCSELELTKWIWHRKVESGYVNPTIDACHNVLLIAARAKDTRLQDSALEILAKVVGRGKEAAALKQSVPR